MLKQKPKEKPKFKKGEKVIVHIYGETFRTGIVTKVLNARKFTYKHTKEDVDRGWLLRQFLAERVRQANTLYGGPWVYEVTYCDNKWAKSQYQAADRIKKFEGLNKTLYA